MAEREEGGPSQDPEARKLVRDTLKERDRQQAADVLAVVSSPHGQRFLAWIMEDCGLLKTSFIDDQRLAAFKDGRRSVASQLCGVAIACDPKYWRAIEDAMLARRIQPSNKPKENQNE